MWLLTYMLHVVCFDAHPLKTASHVKHSVRDFMPVPLEVSSTIHRSTISPLPCCPCIAVLVTTETVHSKGGEYSVFSAVKSNR